MRPPRKLHRKIIFRSSWIRKGLCSLNSSHETRQSPLLNTANNSIAWRRYRLKHVQDRKRSCFVTFHVLTPMGDAILHPPPKKKKPSSLIRQMIPGQLNYFVRLSTTCTCFSRKWLILMVDTTFVIEHYFDEK